MNNNDTFAARKMSYVALYSKGLENTAEHIKTLIVSRTNGLDEGVAFYEALINKALKDSTALEEMNWAGTTFTLNEWREILQKILHGIRTESTTINKTNETA